MGRIRLVLLAVLLGIASGVVASPHHVSLAGNLCGPSLQLGGKCINPVTGWGWPTAFITDNAAVSVLGSVGTDDSFHLGNLLVNILFYSGVLCVAVGLDKQVGSR